MGNATIFATARRVKISLDERKGGVEKDLNSLASILYKSILL